jgi:hypothetical protein
MVYIADPIFQKVLMHFLRQIIGISAIIYSYLFVIQNIAIAFKILYMRNPDIFDSDFKIIIY